MTGPAPVAWTGAAIAFLLAWLACQGELDFHRRTRWRYLAAMGSLQIVGLEKLRILIMSVFAHALADTPWLSWVARASGIWGTDSAWGIQPTWALSQYASPVLFPVAPWVGQAGMTLLVALPQLLLAQAILPLLATPRPANRHWPRIGLAVTGLLLALLLLLAPIFPRWGLEHQPGRGQSSRGQPPITAAVVQPGWEPGTHPNIAAALRAGDPGKVADLLVSEAESSLREAAQQGATLVVWPRDYLNFNPVADRNRGERLLRMARTHGCVLVMPFGFYTPQGPCRGVAVADGTPAPTPGGPLSGTTLAPGQLWSFPIRPGERATLPSESATRPGKSAAFMLAPAPGWRGITQGIVAGHFRLVVIAGRNHPAPWSYVLEVAQSGAALVYADWGLPGQAGVSLVADPGRRQVASARHVAPARPMPRPETQEIAEGTTTVLVTPVSLGPGPGLYARRGDILGWAGVISLILGAWLYRRPNVQRSGV
ncbi:MAG TPA: hypothetical protein GX513_05570, partial [Firmicutes bacterium]|nr:hypothetical protein [Bacillota bacterium]